MSLLIPSSKRYQYSPLRYPGGKASLYPLIDGIIAANNLDRPTYVEPFAGGAGVALSLLMLEKVDRIVINDFDRAIYSFWKALLNDTEKFITTMMRTPVTVPEWRRQKKVYTNKRSAYFSIGFATFFLNRTNRSGVLNAGPIGGHDQTGAWKIGARFNKKDLAARIRKIAFYKDKIELKNEDGILLAKRMIGKKNTIVYLDPPYYIQGSRLYLNHYKERDHQNLAKLLNSKKSGHWLLTYDNVRQIRKLYPKRRINTFALNYHVRDSRKGSEILVISDDLKLPRESVKRNKYA